MALNMKQLVASIILLDSANLFIYLLYDVHYAAKSEAKLGGFSKLLNLNKDYVVKCFRNKA